MTPAQKRPEVPRGSTPSLSPIWFDVRKAAELWNAGRDTHDIGRAMGCHESRIYANLGSIKAEARGLRLTAPELLHQASQDLTNGLQVLLPVSGQRLPTEATLARGADSSPLLAPFSQIHNPTHSASPKFTVAVSQNNSDTGEIGNVPKTNGQAND